MKQWWCVLFPLPLCAHMVSMSTGELRVEGNRAQYELRMPSYEIVHIRNPDRTLLEHIHFKSGGVEGRVTAKSCNDRQGTYICTAVYEFPAPVDALDVECAFASVTVPNHVHVLRAYMGDKTDEAVFDLSFTSAEVRFRPPTALETATREIGAGFMRAAGGLAPLLFLASLVLAGRSRRELLLSTAAFIASESLACIVAPVLPLLLSPRFLEAAAALTIAYLAFEIILLPKSGKRWLIAGVLGLFHGMYFSLFLAGSGYRLAPFLGGVIVGELLLIGLFALGLKKLVSLATLRAVPIAATLLLTVGVVWFVVRLTA